jgi:hypothetical protein
MADTPRTLSDFVRNECLRQFELRADHVLDAIQNADQTDDLEQGPLHLKIHSKRIATASPPYCLLAIERLGPSERTIDFVLKIYSDLADGVDGLSPTHMLEAAALRFGVSIRIGVQVTRFAWAARLPVRNSKDFELLRATVPQGHAMIQQMYLRFESGPPMIADCALCFCIDTTAYTQWLRRHKR